MARDQVTERDHPTKNQQSRQDPEIQYREPDKSLRELPMTITLQCQEEGTMDTELPLCLGLSELIFL